MNWLGIGFLAALILGVWYLYRYSRRTDPNGHKWRTLRRAFEPLVAYDEKQLCQREAQAMADNLWALHNKVWGNCRALYGPEASCKAQETKTRIFGYSKRDTLQPILSRIILNATFTYEGQPAPIKMWLRAGHIHMRPTGTARMYKLFALEVHQLYRAWALGFDRYGKPKPGLGRGGRYV
jgi:hypothetical protein